jgi:subtilisin family serine protease
MSENKKVIVRFSIFGLLAWLLVSLVLKPERSESGPAPQKILLEKTLTIAEHKIHFNIRQAIKKLQSRGVTMLNAASKKTSTFSTALVKIDDFGFIQAYLYLTDVDPAALSALKQHQCRIQIVNSEWKIVQAWVPFTQFAEIAQLESVQAIRPPDYAVKMTGSVTTEGDAVLRADDARSTFGITGSGITVGVISDGVDSRAQAQATQDLPASIEVHPTLPGEGDEGTAMLEIVHDLAPGAQLAFSGPGTSLEMVNSIRYLADSSFGGAGCDIVVDDVGFLGEPAFQDGLLAQTVNAVVATGTTYLTAAGNQADEHYEQNYVAGTITIGNQQIAAHDFGAAAGGSSDATMGVTVAAGGRLVVILHWNDPSPGSSNDYDLLVVDAGADTVVAVSEDEQNGNDFPIEFTEFENQSGGAILAGVIIRNFQANQRLLEIFFIGEDFEVEEYNIAEGSIAPGHQAATGAITIGAIFVLDPGNDTIEFFSSRGPARIFFPTPQERLKPDLAATDGGLITGAGGFGQELPPGSGNIRFFGTSAAAPHAAGVAALVLSAEPSLTPAQVKSALTNAAVDLGAVGADNTFGAGRIDAFAAVQSVITDVADEPATPAQFTLEQNYPNPFNPATMIRYTLPASIGNGPVKLEIFNPLGQRIRMLVNSKQSPGVHQIEWNARDDSGRLAASGLYLYRLQAESQVEIKKMLLLR